MSLNRSLITVVSLALLSVCCTHNIEDRFHDGSITSLSDSLFVVHSVGAYTDDQLSVIYPQEAYVVFDWSQADNLSIIIKYSWHQDRSGFMAEIPIVNYVGSRDDFRVSDEERFEAHCKSWDSSNVKESTIPVTIKSSFRKSADGVTISFVLTPSDNTIFPVLKISDVSTSRIDYERTGGDIVDFFEMLFVFTNELDSPVTIQWDKVLFEPIQLAPKTSKTIFGDESFVLKGLVAFPTDRQNYPACVIVDGHSEEIDFFNEACFSKDNVSEFSLYSGEIEDLSYPVYYFTIPQTLFN